MRCRLGRRTQQPAGAHGRASRPEPRCPGRRGRRGPRRACATRRRMSAWARSCSSSTAYRSSAGASRNSRSRSTVTPSSPEYRVAGQTHAQVLGVHPCAQPQARTNDRTPHAVDLAHGGSEVGLRLLLVFLGAQGIADLPHSRRDPTDDAADPAEGRPQPAQRQQERTASGEPLLVDAVEVHDPHLVRPRVEGVGAEDAPDEAAAVSLRGARGPRSPKRIATSASRRTSSSRKWSAVKAAVT